MPGIIPKKIILQQLVPFIVILIFIIIILLSLNSYRILSITKPSEHLFHKLTIFLGTYLNSPLLM